MMCIVKASNTENEKRIKIPCSDLFLGISRFITKLYKTIQVTGGKFGHYTAAGLK